MANIQINEISQTYSYNIGANTFCTVALPITACWGPGFEDPSGLGISKDAELESIAWNHFASNQSGLEAFVSTYRGPSTSYRAAGDFSYQLAMTLLTSGYDIDVCRLCPGTHAQGELEVDTTTPEEEDPLPEGSIVFTAKYAGTFGNSIFVTLNKVANRGYWNMIVYAVDSQGVKTALENLTFFIEENHENETIPSLKEVSSDFVNITTTGTVKDDSVFTTTSVQLGSGSNTKGTDRAADDTAVNMMTAAISLATSRFAAVSGTGTDYIAALTAIKTAGTDVANASNIRYNEWLYTYSLDVYDLLKDRLAYNPNRIISPGWDDQDICKFTGDAPGTMTEISPIHAKLMEVAASSRCGTALIDIPRSCARSAIHSESPLGYAQILSRHNLGGSDGLYASHSALFAPWGTYIYSGTNKQNPASPSFLALLIQRSMLRNQSLQYEWALPTNRKHNISVGKLDYTVPKKLLDTWQSTEGVAVNAITAIPDLGTSIWGNSTLFELAPASYNALWNLSTRYLVNAIENVVYRAGIGITFAYNNQDAYAKFYAAVTPILDTMKNVGAVDGYVVRMSSAIDNLGQVQANSVVGKIYLTINGVINDITVDLVCLPPSQDLSQL